MCENVVHANRYGQTLLTTLQLINNETGLIFSN